MMKKTLFLFVTCLTLLAVLCGCGKTQTPVESTSGSFTSAAGTPTAQSTPAAEPGETLSGLHHVQIEMEDGGVIRLELDADRAPVTVTNFISLAESGFYDGLTFHRIMAGFMMQGGDPTGTGFGGSEEKITGEFAANGWDNDISHVRGVISMARSGDPNSASSQFFIVHEDSTLLDGSYAAFGHVTEGMDVVDSICENARPTDNNGSIRPEEQPVMRAVTVID